MNFFNFIFGLLFGSGDDGTNQDGIYGTSGDDGTNQG